MSRPSSLSRPLMQFALIVALLMLPFLPGSASADVLCGDAPAASSPAPTATPAALPDAAFPEDGGTLTVFAAVSLTDAFAEMEQRLEETHPGLDVVIETAGSQTLVTQLEQGAQADVLATANTTWMDTAAQRGLTEGEAVSFTGNRLVIIAPAGNPAEIEAIDDLAGDDVSLILAGADVPAGTYAQRAFCSFGATDNAPEGFIENINDNLVSEEQDVRSVLAKIQLGEGDAGVVYASDAAAATRSGEGLIIIEFPESVPTGAVYPIAPVVGGDPELANAFIAYVLSDEGQEILADYGFSPIP